MFLSRSTLSVTVRLLFIVLTLGYFLYFRRTSRTSETPHEEALHKRSKERKIEPESIVEKVAAKEDPIKPENIVEDVASKDDALYLAAKKVAQTRSDLRKFVIVLAATNAYLPYVYNAGCSLKRIGNYSALVMALDRDIAAAKMPQNLHIYRFDDKPSEERRYFTDPAFDKLSRSKVSAVLAVLETGFDVLFLDSDVAWCAENGPSLLAEAAMHNITFQYSPPGREVFNTGVYYARSCEESKKFLSRSLEIEAKTDQHAIGKIACEGEGVKYGNPENDVPDYCVWKNTTTLGVLDPQKYPIGCSRFNGTTLFFHNSSTVSEMCSSGAINMLHYSCYRDDHKIKYMKGNNMWFVSGETQVCSNK